MKDYCSFWDGQHKCQHRWRLISITAAYESWWEVYELDKLVYEGNRPYQFMLENR